MTLLIAYAIFWHMGASFLWYILAIPVWVGHLMYHEGGTTVVQKVVRTTGAKKGG